MPGDHKQKKKVKDLREKLGKIRKSAKFKIGPGDHLEGEINDYLFELQESGQANMVTEAGGYLMRDFKLPRNEASAYMNHWVRNFKKLKSNRDVFNKTGVYPEGNEGMKYGKIRKADVSDINRVTRWDERTFNKRREMPKKREEDVEIDRSDVELHPYQAIAKLRNRLAKVSKKKKKKVPIYDMNYDPQTDPDSSEYIPEYDEDSPLYDAIKDKHRGYGKRLAKVENYKAESDPEASAGEWLGKYRKKRKSKVRRARELWEEQGYKKKPSWYGETCPGCGKEITNYPALSREDNETYICDNCGVEEAMGEFLDLKGKTKLQGHEKNKSKRLRKDGKLRQRLSRIRKANGGIAPNFANPSKSHDPNEKKKKQKTAYQKERKKKGSRLTSVVSKGPIKKPKNKQYLERRKKKDYVKNAKDQIKGKSTGQPMPDNREFQRKRLKRLMGDITSGNMTPTPEQIEKKKIRDKKEADAAKKLYEKRHRGKAKKARIRRATEIIDPRKKKKTVRPGSDVQKVSKLKQRIAEINDENNPNRDPSDANWTSAANTKRRKKKTKRVRDPVHGYSNFGDKSLQHSGEMKVDKEHNHKIQFRVHEGSQYRRASLSKQEGKYAKYWLLNAKQTNGNGWGVSQTSIAKNINKFIGRPFVITAKQWVAESEYGDQFEHPYLPTNNISQIINHQEKFRVGSIVDVIEKDGDYHAVIEMNSKFANMMLPPFCSPAIFQNNPGEADGQISDWEALHLAGLMEDPAYGARIAILKGSCMGTADACSVQFKSAKQAKMVCPKKMKNLKGRIAGLRLDGSEDLTDEYEGKGKVALPRVSEGFQTPKIVRHKGTILQPGKREAYPLHQDYDFKSKFQTEYEKKKPFKGKAKDYGKKKAGDPFSPSGLDPESVGDILTISETNAERWAKLKGRLAAVIKPKKADSVDNTIDKLVKEVKDPANKEDLVKRLGTTPNEHGPKNYGATKAKDFSSRRKVSKLKQRLATEFGTLGPDGKVRNKGSIDLNKVDSDDPIAYGVGYSEGARGDKISPEGDAPEYRRGWKEGNSFFKKTLKKTRGKGKFSKKKQKIAKLRQRLARVGYHKSFMDNTGALEDVIDYQGFSNTVGRKLKGYGVAYSHPRHLNTEYGTKIKSFKDMDLALDERELMRVTDEESGRKINIGNKATPKQLALIKKQFQTHNKPVLASITSLSRKRYKNYNDFYNAYLEHSGQSPSDPGNTEFKTHTQMLGGKLRQRLSKIRTAKPIIQETGLGIKYKHNRPIEPTSEIAKEGYGYHKVPFHPTNAILIRPNEPKDFMKMVKHLRKVVTTHEFSNLPHGMNDRVSLPLGYLKNKVKYGDKFGTGTLGEAVDKLKHHATISTATNKAFKKGDILMRRVGSKPTPGPESIYRYGGVGDTYYIEEDSPKGELFNAPSKYRKPGSQATIDYERSLEKKKLGKLRSATIKPLTKKKKKGKAIRKVSSKSK